MDAFGDLVEAEKQYFARLPANTPKQFAQRLVSDQGQHDGLYDSLYNEAESPFGKDQVNQGGPRGPFNGYFFRILTSQGRHAPGGAKNYVVDGKMTAGFAFVAYPAE
jgi:hypothetical protein